MIVYEVNLEIERGIVESYKKWLIPHVDSMLAFDGFVGASILEEQREHDDYLYLTVIYHVQSQDALQHYFDNHATQMRDDGIARFGHQFKATRRIFTTVFEKTPCH